ncbi:MAG: hypothetical protein K0R98_2021 [Rickettsiaceae bacterium]|jgi:hypothetical protein|nr:hypothetical protein [Rickettsiaceae bacterium]
MIRHQFGTTLKIRNKILDLTTLPKAERIEGLLAQQFIRNVAGIEPAIKAMLAKEGLLKGQKDESEIEAEEPATEKQDNDARNWRDYVAKVNPKQDTNFTDKIANENATEAAAGEEMAEAEYLAKELGEKTQGKPKDRVISALTPPEEGWARFVSDKYKAKSLEQAKIRAEEFSKKIEETGKELEVSQKQAVEQGIRWNIELERVKNELGQQKEILGKWTRGVVTGELGRSPSMNIGNYRSKGFEGPSL